ncbi:BQ5605_C017g08509 [Microbotryum silenes-dioicae]|uniref:BQ5605_C017g08509 protein n=1 Tax=Microbotryum silenes-dioicae TaxID=796604 RepID=A0A2X0MGP5_9BASI|nr:BQ5605_C017g08509 [Microbotryum silenes-dioicae]
MESDLDEVALQDYNDYEHSGADDEEARAYNLIDRGLATDLVVSVCQGFEYFIVGCFSRGVDLSWTDSR